MARTKQTARKSSLLGGGAKAAKTAKKKSTQNETAIVKKPHRFRPGTVALRQIRKYQKSTDELIPRASIERLIREIGGHYKSNLKWQPKAIEALQVGAENWLVKLFERTNLNTIHREKITITPKDLQLALCNEKDEFILEKQLDNLSKGLKYGSDD